MSLTDLFISQDFDVALDQTNDLKMVTGREAFEQTIALSVTDYFYNEIGSVDHPNTLAKLEIYTKQVVREYDSLDGVVSIVAEFTSDKTLEVTIRYDGGEEFTFPVFSTNDN